MRTLFQISDDLFALEAILAEVGGEITDDEAGAALEKFFDELGAERDAKIDNYCALIRELEARAEAREAEAKRLTALAGSDANSAKRLKNRLLVFFEIQEISKLDTARFRVAVQKNGGALPLIFPEEWEREPARAPERYHKQTIALNKTLLREDAEFTQSEIKKLKADVEAGKITPEQAANMLHVAEFTNKVRLGERGTHLRIR